MGMVGLRDVYLVAPAYHHHHHQNAGLVSGSDQINSNAAASLGVGVIPLLTAAPAQQHQNAEDTDINFLGNSRRWQNNDSSNNQTEYLRFKSTTVASSSNNSGSGSAGTATCQDCGNQAKKECKQRRCRTCCKSRGFDCSTHVKSTWVSAARRRERQVMPTGNPTAAGSSPSTSSGTKKPRIAGSQQQATSHTSTSNTPPQSLDTSSSRKDGGPREAWPGQVKAAAVFKCVKVTAMEDGDDEYAYQAVVKIGGHIFKGFLYDQGLEPKEGFPNISDLLLGGGASNHNGVSASPSILDPPNVYGGGGGAGAGFYG
ncbi:protein LATERAL ROOT PRIMORDIUM 1 [Raphanus sativus]|uniref:Protein LATERAL ROOT PRIMORDIUM 1 n=1 Tax=Raphanus sativus TaxID=3726 RepID=A0A6J0MBW1_RAPSA|nr:protein LATERAL ROOT PRIMORDIUM 1 [Raphanus sativus]